MQVKFIAECSPFQGEHSAILLTLIQLPLVIKTFVLSIFEWPFYIGFTGYQFVHGPRLHIGHLVKTCVCFGFSNLGQNILRVKDYLILHQFKLENHCN